MAAPADSGRARLAKNDRSTPAHAWTHFTNDKHAACKAIRLACVRSRLGVCVVCLHDQSLREAAVCLQRSTARTIAGSKVRRTALAALDLIARSIARAKVRSATLAAIDRSSDVYSTRGLAGPIP